MLWLPRRPFGRRPDLKEGLTGIVLVAFISGVSYLLTDTFYQPNFDKNPTESVVYTILTGIGSTLNPWIPGETHLFLYLPLVGLLFGFVFVWALDYYKRYQAIFLLVAILGGLVATAENGHLLPAFAENFTLTNVLALLVGVVGGIQISGVDLIGAARDPTKRALGDAPREFPRAPNLVLRVFSFVFVLNFLDYHFLDARAVPFVRSSVNAQPMVVPHLLGGVLALGAFWKFTEYESEIRTVQIGPARAGKTATFGGLYEYLDEDGNGYHIDTDREKFDQEILERLDENRFPKRNSGAEVDEEKSAQTLKIPFISKGWLFRKRIVLSTIDYPGELIGETGPSLDGTIAWMREAGDIPDDDDTRRSRVESLIKAGNNPKELEKEETPAAKLVEALALVVEAADVVILTIPLDDFLQPVASNDELPDYVDGYWAWRDDDDRVRAARIGGGPVELDEELNDIEHLPTYDHDEYGRVRLYIPGEHGQRSSTQVYLEEYESLVERYGTTANDEERKEFIWTVTKADYAESQFKSAFKETVNAEVGDELADVVATDPRVIPDRTKAQKLFARWTERLIDFPENWDGFRTIRKRTGERFVYPLWFQIDNDEPPTDDEELTFNTARGNLLQGAEYLVDRIERRPFVEQRNLGTLLPKRETQRKVDYVTRQMYREYLHATNDRSDDQKTATTTDPDSGTTDLERSGSRTSVDDTDGPDEGDESSEDGGPTGPEDGSEDGGPTSSDDRSEDGGPTSVYGTEP